MDVGKKIKLIERNTEEIINENKIKNFMKKGVVYCGYEPAGEIHLGHLVTMMKLLDFQKAGIKPIILLANWHAWLNKKGDWKFLDNQVKIWEKGMRAAGLTKAKFVKGTDFQRKEDYINDIMIMALNTTVNRGLRSMQTVARDIENAKISQIIYPLMQVEDVKKLGVNFVVAGSDQRKIYMLGLDVGKEIKLQDAVYLYTPLIPSLRGALADEEKSELIELGYTNPVEVMNDYKISINNIDSPEKREEYTGLLQQRKLIESFVGTVKEKKITFHLNIKGPDGDFKESFKIGEGKSVGDIFVSLEGVKEGKVFLRIYGKKKQKMSSSVKESFISIRDSKNEIKRKINKAFCEFGNIQNNPILAIVKLIIFPKFGKLRIKRDKKYGGGLEFENYKSLEKAFESGKVIHALDLKNAVAEYLEKIIAPIRKAWK